MSLVVYVAAIDASGGCFSQLPQVCGLVVFE